MEAGTKVINASNPFEGPEKLLEIWFTPSPTDVQAASAASTIDGKHGLRKVDRSVWEDMLAVVKCQVLSVVEGTETDAYLLR
jgi:S-adenosylmethionine decarboxylase